MTDARARTREMMDEDWCGGDGGVDVCVRVNE